MIGYILLSLIIITLGFTTYNQLRKVEKSKSVDDKHISTIMNLYELLKEIKVVTK